MAQIGTGSQTSAWPGGIDTTQTWQNGSNTIPDSDKRLDAEGFNDFGFGIVNLQNGLGQSPNGSFATVQARLDQYLPTSNAVDFKFVAVATSGGANGAGYIELLVEGLTRYIPFSLTP